MKDFPVYYRGAHASAMADLVGVEWNVPFKREMIRTRKYRTKEIYPRLSPELEKVFEEWKKTHPRP